MAAVEDDRPANDALYRYQRDMLTGMRKFLLKLRAAEARIAVALDEEGGELEEMGQAGVALVEYAYDDDGELRNPDAQEMVDAIDNGILPDLDDARRAILDPLRDLIEDMGKRIARLADVVAPKDAMTLVMTPEREERAQERD